MNFQKNQGIGNRRNFLKYKNKHIHTNKKSLSIKALLIFIACIIAGFISHYISENSSAKNENTNSTKTFAPLESPTFFDGDSFNATYNNKKIRIRLYGVDAPEKSQAFCNISRTALINLLYENKDVHIEVLYHDPYNRAVSIVHFENGNTLQEELLRNGHTWVYAQFCDKPFCDEWLQLEEDARNDKIGLWQDNKPIPPWKWRKDRRNK